MKTARRTLSFMAVALLGMTWLVSSAQAKTIKVVANGTTEAIQTAITAAEPYDTVSVPPGTYSGPTVKVEKNNLTLKGSKSAIIDAAGNTYGITVGTKLTFDEGPTCPAYSVSNFRIIGLSVQDADDSGIFLFGANGFHVSNGSYLNNGEYGIFPRCSREGLINGNSGGGGEDATIYVGVDDGITVERNKLSNGEIGVELESTDNSVVRKNTLTENTVGISVIVLPHLPKSATEKALIEENRVVSNNRVNPVPPVCEGPEEPPGCVKELTDDLQLVPSGTGILNVGGHDITIRNNTVRDNNTGGVGVVENPFGFGTSSNTTITGNTITKNGKNPDPRTKGSGDIVYLDNPENGSCISGNIFATSFYPFGAPPACS